MRQKSHERKEDRLRSIDRMESIPQNIHSERSSEFKASSTQQKD